MIDLVAIVVIGLLTWSGYRRGAVKEITSIASLIIAFLLSAHLYSNIADLLMPIIKHRTISVLAGILLLFTSSVVCLHILASYITKMLSWTILGEVNKLAGASIGALKGIVLIVITVSVLLLFMPVEGTNTLAASKVVPRVMLLAGALSDLTPNSIRERVGNFELDSYRAMIGSEVRTLDNPNRNMSTRIEALVKSCINSATATGVVAVFDPVLCQGTIEGDSEETVRICPSSFHTIGDCGGIESGDAVRYTVVYDSILQFKWASNLTRPE